MSHPADYGMRPRLLILESHEATKAATFMARVLVVDDNPDVADTLAVLLQVSGHEVLPLDNGFAALSEVNRRLPDAIVLDIGLPALDGIHVARRLRQHYGDSLRLVACTAYNDDRTRRKMVEAGFDVILTKPASVDDLLNAIATANVRRNHLMDRRREARPARCLSRDTSPR